METFPVTGRNFLSQEEIISHRKKFPVTERNFLSQGENSSLRKKLSSDRTKSNVTEWNSIPDQRKKFPVAGWYFPSQDKISCHRKKFPSKENFILKDQCACIVPKPKMLKITHNKFYSELSRFMLSWAKFWRWKRSCQEVTNIIQP